jgi:hypothetical protein
MYVEGFDGYPLLGPVQWVLRTKLEAFFSILPTGRVCTAYVGTEWFP